jgi:hypothetical protein
MKSLALAITAALAFSTANAKAQDVIEIDPTAPSKPMTTSDPAKTDPRKADGDWARGVMARAAGGKGEAEKAPICERNPDRSPHGVVWGEIGTGGYRSIGTVVTTPVCDCGELTVGVSQGQNEMGGRGRRR